MDVTTLSDDPRSQAAVDANWSTIRVVDLFELPQRIALRAQGKSFREIGRQLGITMSAVQAVAAFDRQITLGSNRALRSGDRVLSIGNEDMPIST